MNDVQLQQEFVFRRLSESWQIGGREVSGLVWLAVLIPVLLLGLLYVIWMYRRDTASISRWCAILLGACRAAVYLTLAGVFLLPAMQTWESTQKRSRVVLLLDASPSVSEISDDLPPEDGKPAQLPTRLDKLVTFLTDAQAKFIARLAEKNPVWVYRFGARLDEEPAVFDKDRPTWNVERWTAWLKMDLKRWLLDQLDAPTAQALTRHPAFEADKPGTAAWAASWLQLPPADVIPLGLDEPQREKFLAARARLEKRADAVRQIRSGTDMGESVLQLLAREGSNMVQGMVIVSDGRSNLGAESTISEARARAVNDRVPLFTVQLGEDRQQVEIRLTDVQTPEQTPPNERFVVRAEVDGIGLQEQEATVFLDIYAPKADAPTHTLESKVAFQSGTPPHVQAEFPIDPDAATPLPGALVGKSTTGKNEFVEGEWKFVVRIPRDRREAFAAKEHVSEPTTVQVIKKPLRVLLVAGGPTHDYQFVRTMLVREKDMKRAEVSIFLQNEGRDGRAVQDVDQDRMLSRFPTSLRVEDDPNEKPDERYYNLGRYDLVIAYDPDWSEFTAEQLDLLKKWVDTQAGGLIVVAGPVNMFQLARGEEGGRLKPLLDILPVVPGDSVLVSGGMRRQQKNPSRLNFAGASPDTEFLKLDDDAKEPLAGWREFFDGSEKSNDPTPQRGFYNAYPIKSVKPGATVVATIADPTLKMADGRENPFLITMPYGKGRVAFLGSGEMRRLRQYKEVFYERFWLKLGRWCSAGGRTRQNRRGVLVMGRQFSAGGFVRVEAQLFGPTLEPLPRTTRAKMTVVTVDGTDRKEIELTPKPGAGEWAGWFQARFPSSRPGEYRLELPIPGSGDTLRGKFSVKATDPELDNPRPDLAALVQLAGEFREVEDRLPDVRSREEVRGKLRIQESGGSPTESRLCMTLSAAEVIPQCMASQQKEQRNRGAVDDLWDDGPVFGHTADGRKIEVSAVLLLVVGLLSFEWLCRKLLRLA